MSIDQLRNVRLSRFRDDQHNFQRSNDVRSDYEHDYGRLIHSPAFRRLQGKSQVFGAGAGDYFRTRLTHSLEVAQIARHVATKLIQDASYTEAEAANAAFAINPSVVECAALVHDIGHPPFGHKGEEVLNELLTKQDPNSSIHFEGNAQNFRILMFLEKRKKEDGLDLTAATLLALNKYPFPGNRSRLKGVYGSEWDHISMLRDSWNIPTEKRTLEAQLMDLCDDIAYSTHDIEDGIKSKKIEFSKIEMRDRYFADLLVKEVVDKYPEGDPMWEGESISERVDQVLVKYFRKWKKILKEYNYDESRARREMKAETVNLYVTNIGIIDHEDWKKVTFVSNGVENFGLLREVIILKKLAWITMIKDLRVQRLQKRSEKIVKGLWESFYNDQNGIIIPSDWMERYNQHQKTWSWERFITDYISGMTDSFAEKIYSELYGFNSRSIYDID